MIKQKHSLSFLLLLTLGFTWGTGYSLARFAMTNGVPPLGYSFWQSLGPAIIISLIVLICKKGIPLSRTHCLYYLICGLTGIVIPNTTMYFAAPHLPASILAVIVNTVPIIAYLMALIAQLETFHWQRMLGILCACIGLMLIVLPKSSLPSTDMIPWVTSTLITPVSFAFCSIFIARYRPANTDSFSLTAGMLISSSLLLLPLTLFKQSFYLPHFPFNAADGVILLEIMLSSLGYVLFFKLIKIAGPVYYSLVDTIVVLTGLFWGRIIFGEQLNSWTTAAVSLIFFSLLLVTQQQRQQSKRQLMAARRAYENQ